MASIQRTVHARVSKTDDIEIHVSTLETETGQYADIREFIISLQQYGRGITFPARFTETITRGLDGVQLMLPDTEEVAVSG